MKKTQNRNLGGITINFGKQKEALFTFLEEGYEEVMMVTLVGDKQMYAKNFCSLNYDGGFRQMRVCIDYWMRACPFDIKDVKVLVQAYPKDENGNDLGVYVIRNYENESSIIEEMLNNEEEDYEG